MSRESIDTWLGIFEARSARAIPKPNSPSEYQLQVDERRDLGASMAVFALGESSDGACLKRAAHDWGQTEDFPELDRLVDLFIREENGHSRLLKDILEANALPLAKASWSDSVFRFIRRQGGLWGAVTPLVTAEIIALTYYAALGRASANAWLRSVCDRIDEDERLHIAYEADLIRAVESSWSGPRIAMGRGFHRSFTLIVAIVVWLQHRSVLKRSRMNLVEFCRSCLKDQAEFAEATAKESAAHLAIESS